MAHRSEFYLYKRKKKRGSYWYVCFIDPKTGKQGNAKSIDVLKERLGLMDLKSVKRRDEAAIIAHKALERGIVGIREKKILFSDYCLSFWDYESSIYIKRRNSMKKNSIGREYAANMYFFLKRDVLPLLDNTLYLTEIGTRDLDMVLTHLLVEKGLSGGTVQLIALSFSLPLKEAYREGLIKDNPASRLMKIVRDEKERGCFTKEECQRILEELEKEKEELFSSYYYAILLALVTGMRSGEIRALHEEDLEESPIEGLWVINVRHSISPYSGLKGTKGKYERQVLIPKPLALALLENKDKKGLLLPSLFGGYISSPTLRTKFYEILEKIGIDSSERERRNLKFHSLRHTFSTLGRDMNISQEDRMLVLGHRSESVNNRYTHESLEALRRVSAVTLELLSGAEKCAEN